MLDLDCDYNSSGPYIELSFVRAQGGCDQSAETAYSSMEHDPTFTFVGGQCCPKLHSVSTFWIMIIGLTHCFKTLLFCVEEGRQRKHVKGKKHRSDYKNGRLMCPANRSTSELKELISPMNRELISPVKRLLHWKN
jgi:hypothetical protein